MMIYILIFLLSSFPNKHFLPAESETIFAYTSLGDSFCNKVCLIIFFLYLTERRLYGIREFFFFPVLYFKFYDDSVGWNASALHPGFQHDVIAAKSGFAVGGDDIFIRKLYHQPKHKTMLKPFRLLSGALFSCVKTAEDLCCHLVHVNIHCFYVAG